VAAYKYWTGASKNLFPLFVNASGAVWNKTIYEYVTTCNFSQIGTVEINLGNDNQTSKKLVLTAADFIDYSPGKDVCYLTVGGYSNFFWHDNVDYIELGYQFLNNHCVAYNQASSQFGIATSIRAPDFCSTIEVRKCSAKQQYHRNWH